jgi:uncharacterized protein with beta-barrel porin domain
MHQRLAVTPVVDLEPSDRPLAEQVLVAQASWVLRVQPAQQVLVVTAETARAAAASVQQVFPAVAVAAVDSQAAVAPVADLQELPVAAVMIKEQEAVAPAVLHSPAV